jgi:CDP-diacylglycerol--glycerol-3-phosphate 3-phosphatidyltransferase
MAGVARTKRTSGCVATAFFGRARIYRGVTRSALAIAQPARVCSRLLRPMNLPNILTISRVPLMFIIVALMFIDLPWAATTAFWLFIVAALTDWLDGKLARERGEVSAFGRFMDAVIDKVLVIGLMIALVGNPENFLGHDISAVVLLLCILCREFAISGLRMAVAVKGQVVEADAGGKVKTFVQLNAIGWLMGARMLALDHAEKFGGDDRSVLTAVRVFGMSLYALSAVLTITSGYAYFRRHGRVLFN